MNGLIITLIVIIVVLAIAILILALLAIGFSCYCQSTDGVGYISKIVFNKPNVTNNTRHRVLYDMLSTVLEYTKGIKVWMMEGTLLGFIRENQIICYDYDLDLQIMEDDWLAIKVILDKIVRERREYGYVWYKFPNRKYAQLYHRETMTGCDFQVSKVNGGMLDGKFLLVDVFPLKTMNIRNIYNNLEHTVYIPNDPHAVLKTSYGSNYMIADHECDKDCENCIRVINS